MDGGARVLHGFGAAVYGVNGVALEAARKISGSVMLLGGGERSSTRGLLMAANTHPDPICHEGIAPIYAWCQGVFGRNEGGVEVR